MQLVSRVSYDNYYANIGFYPGRSGRASSVSKQSYLINSPCGALLYVIGNNNLYSSSATDVAPSFSELSKIVMTPLDLGLFKSEYKYVPGD